MNLVERAHAFAANAHSSINQRRKYSGEPYIVHPAAVVKIVRSVAHDEAMLAAAWLHDVVEDTPVTLNIVRKEFGDGVADLVGWLTAPDYPVRGPEKSTLERDRWHNAPARAQTIKVADIIHNLSTVAELDPAFASTYFPEKKVILGALTRANPALIAEAEKTIVAYFKRTGGSEPGRVDIA